MCEQRILFSIYRLCKTCILCLCFSGIAASLSSAAVPANGIEGTCGPYYLWYQTGPVRYQEYVDFCGITFDIQDVIDDFDFVFFEDTPNSQRASLDQNQDGWSDAHFFKREGSLLEWKPTGGCIRITQRGCESGSFDPACGHAIIRVQPRRDSENGSAVIPISAYINCPSHQPDCRKTFIMRHAYTGCERSTIPGFVLLQGFNSDQKKFHDEDQVAYIAKILNTGGKAGKTLLKMTVSEGSNQGKLQLTGYNIECPPGGKCTIPHMGERELQVLFENFPTDQQAKAILILKADTEGIPMTAGEQWTSNFTISSTLSTGGQYSKPVTIGHRITQK